MRQSKNFFNRSDRSIGVGTYKYLGGKANGFDLGGKKAVNQLRLHKSTEKITILKEFIIEDLVLAKRIFDKKWINPIKQLREIDFDWTNLDTELAWSMGYIRTNSNIIRSHINTKESIYKLYFLGEFDKILELIDNFISDFGLSFVYLQLRISILQKIGGIEAQKSFRKELVKKYGVTNYSFVGSIFSERTETGVIMEAFKKRIEYSINQWPISKEYKYFYNDLFYRRILKDENSTANLINIGTTVSTVDIYEYISEAYETFPDKFSLSDSEYMNQLLSNFDESLLKSEIFEDLLLSIYNFSDFDQFKRSEIAKEMLFLRFLPKSYIFWRTFNYLITSSFEEWSEIRNLNPITTETLNPVLRLREDIFIMLENQKIDEVFKKTIEIICKNSDIINSLPMVKIISQFDIDESKYKKISERSSIIDAYLRNSQNAELKEKAAWYFEDFLEENLCDLPSELPDTAFSSVDSQVYFLRNTCNYNNLSFLDSLPTTRDIENEQIAILLKLVEIDNVNTDAYREDITSIMTRISVQDGIKMVDQSRIYVDTKSILKWSVWALGDTLKRYFGLLKSLTHDDLRLSIVRLIIATSENENKAIKFLDVARDESVVTLIAITEAIRDRFLFDPEHGLNTFLSMRIRHGTLAGTLRGPSRAENLFCIKGVDGFYKENDYWLKHEIPENKLIIQQCLEKFTQDFDDIVQNEIKPLFHVKSDKSSKGMLNADLSAEDIYKIQSWALSNKENTLEEFLEAVFEVLRIKLTFSLNGLANELETNKRVIINNIFVQVIENIRKVNSENAERLRTAFLNARSNTNISLDLVTSWLKISDHDSLDMTFSAERMLAIGIKSATKLINGFDPLVDLHLHTQIEFGISMVREISDLTTPQNVA